MKKQAKIYKEINASKFGKFTNILKYRCQEISPQIRSAKNEICLALFTPKNRGIVFKFRTSYSTSLMSKGIVIAKTNKKSDANCQIIFSEIKISFSNNSSSIVLTAQIKETIKILANGIFLNKNGYNTEIIPANKIAS